MHTLDVTTFPYPSGYINGVESLSRVAFNGNGNVAEILSATDFTFNGAYFAAAWRDGFQIEVIGYNGANILYDQTITVSTYGSTYFTFNYVGINKLEIISIAGTGVHHPGYANEGSDSFNFVMDNFTYNEPICAPVPEPSTMLLLGSGLAGLVAFRKKFQQV